MDGQEVRRSYSICSGPDDGELRIAVKKVDGGAFRPGPRMDEYRRPNRRDDADRPLRHRSRARRSAGLCRLCRRVRHHADPSIVKGVLAREPNSQFFLFYGNRSTTGMLFLEELEELKDRFMQRFSLFHVISGEEQDIPILHGRLDGGKVRVLLRSLVPASSVDHAFICGPTGRARTSRRPAARSALPTIAFTSSASSGVRRQAAAEESH